MTRHFSELLERVPAAPFMLVQSGTSRLVVLNGKQIRPGRQGYDEVRRIMLGSHGRGGLGGTSLQDNKVVLVWPEAEPARFRFLQVVPSTKSVLPMECSNSAAASAMLLQFGGYRPGIASSWPAVNLFTRQQIELRPEDDHDIAKAWKVRFLITSRARKALQGLCGERHVRVAGKSIAYRPVLLGNLFLFADLDPDKVDANMIEAIARAGMRVSREAGFARMGNYAPKVIPYKILSAGSQPRIRAASFYYGERHRSFPGSAAMVISSFLASRHRNGEPIRSHWQVQHPSGSVDVKLGFDASRPDSKLVWAEFVTPIELLSWGHIAMPWRRAG